MGRLTLSQAQSIPDPFNTHDWNVIFPSIPGSAALNLRQLSYRAQTAAVPGLTVESMLVSYKDVELSYANRQIWSKSMNMNFVEVRDMSTRSAFLGWSKFARSMQAGVGTYKNEYATTVVMELYDATDSVIRIVKLINCWPSEVGELSLESPGQTGVLPVTFVFDATEET